MYEVLSSYHADVRYAVRSCLIYTLAGRAYAPGLRIPRHPNGVVFIYLLAICQKPPLKCYGVLPSFSLAPPGVEHLWKDETDGGGLEHCRTAEPMGVSLFHSL
jgi:hypothetical protein